MKNYIILVLFVLIIIWILLPQPITSPNHFDYLFAKYEKLYDDTSLYTFRCEDRQIMMVAANYGRKGEQQKCKEWLVKRKKCISLHPEYKDITFKDISKICIKREEK